MTGDKTERYFETLQDNHLEALNAMADIEEEAENERRYILQQIARGDRCTCSVCEDIYAEYDPDYGWICMECLANTTDLEDPPF